MVIWFNGISTFDAYLVPNPVYIYTNLCVCEIFMNNLLVTICKRVKTYLLSPR